MPNGAELFVRTNAALGIDTVFTLVGDHLNEVLLKPHAPECESWTCGTNRRWPMRPMRGRAFHRKPALSLVTGGPGHTNSLTGIATAQPGRQSVDRGERQPARNSADRQAFQDIDQVGMARPVVKWAARTADAARRFRFIWGAPATVANSGPQGRGTLDHSGRSVSGRPRPLANAARRRGGARRRLPSPCLTADHSRCCGRRSGRWSSPAAASGGRDAGGGVAAIHRANPLPLYTITMARGAVSDEHPLCMGYADPALNHAVHSAFREADLFLVIGKRIDYRLAMGGPRLFSRAGALHPNRHPRRGAGTEPRSWIWRYVPTPARRWRQLTEAAGAEPGRSGRGCDRLRGSACLEWRSALDGRAAIGSPLHPAAFFRELAAALPPDVLYSWDGGDFAHWGRASAAGPPCAADGCASGRWATIGSSLPNRLALQLAHPGAAGGGHHRRWRAGILPRGNGHAWCGHKLRWSDCGQRRGLGARAGTAIGSYRPCGSTVACELQSARYDLVMQGLRRRRGDHRSTRPGASRPLCEPSRRGVPYCLNVKIRGSAFAVHRMADRG